MRKYLYGLPEAMQEKASIERTTVQEEWQLKELVEKIRAAKIVAVDTETTSLSIPLLGLVGISFAFSDTDAWYIPVGHTELDKQMPLRAVLGALKPVLEMPDKKYLFHHAKYDIAVFRKFGINIPMLISEKFRTIEDTMVQSWILDVNEKKSLKKLALKKLGMEMATFQSLFGSKKSKKVDEEEFITDDDEDDVLDIVDNDSTDEDYNLANIAVNIAAAYAKDDAIATWRLFHYFRPLIKQERLFGPYLRELQLTPCMVNLNWHGVMVNQELANKKYDEAVAELKQIEFEIKDTLLKIPAVKTRVEARIPKLSKKDRKNGADLYSPEVFKLGSSQLLSGIFYEDMKLANEKTIKTATGNYSTGKWAIAELVNRGKLPGANKMEKIASEVCEKMKIRKKKSRLISGFFEPIAKKAINGRVYGSFNNVATRTGRLASAGPNLQNMPTDTKEYSFREIFIVPEKHLWGSIDMSQIELRTAAWLSGDSNLREAYLNNEDLHTKTTFILFKEKPEDFENREEDIVFKTHRKTAKVYNFAYR